MKQPTWRGVISIIASIIVALLAFKFAVSEGHGSHFNPDESRWLSRAHYLADLAAPFGPTWADQYMTRGQPPLGSYAMGVGLLLQGRDLQTNPPWDFSLPWEVNVAVGHKPSSEDLAAGRTFSAALTALTSLVIIIIAKTYVAMPWALVAGALYALHPFTAYIGSIAMSDALFGLMIASAAWAAAALGRRPTPARALLLGAMLGLGGATKLSPLAVAAGLTVSMMAIVAISALRRQPARQTHVQWGGLAVLISGAALATFVAVYPYLWPDPVTRSLHLFAFRAEEMAAQASDWPSMAVSNRMDALGRVHSNFSDRYNLAATFTDLLVPGQAPYWIRQTEIAVAVTGLIVLAFVAARAGPFSAQTLVLLVLGGQALVTILGMRSEFDRYHLPLLILGVVAGAAALEWIVKVMRSRTASGPVGTIQGFREQAIRARADSEAI